MIKRGFNKEFVNDKCKNEHNKKFKCLFMGMKKNCCSKSGSCRSNDHNSWTFFRLQCYGQSKSKIIHREK